MLSATSWRQAFNYGTGARSSKAKRNTRVIATYNIKGGVGKTSAAVNLAYLAAQAGHPTCSGSRSAGCQHISVPRATQGQGRRPRPASQAQLRRRPHQGDRPPEPRTAARRLLLPAPRSGTGPVQETGGAAAQGARPLRDEYDYIFLDCPPSISLVSEAVFEVSDALLVPVIPATLSSRAYEQLEGLSRAGKVGRRGTSILAFFSMADVSKCLHLKIMERLRKIERLTVLGVAIPSSDEVEKMGEERIRRPCSLRTARPPSPTQPPGRSSSSACTRRNRTRETGPQRHLAGSTPQLGLGGCAGGGRNRDRAARRKARWSDSSLGARALRAVGAASAEQADVHQWLGCGGGAPEGRRLRRQPAGPPAQRPAGHGRERRRQSKRNAAILVSPCWSAHAPAARRFQHHSGGWARPPCTSSPPAAEPAPST